MQRLPIQQFHDQLIEDISVGVEDVPGLRVCRFDKRPHFFVDFVRDFEGVVRLPSRGAAEEWITLFLAVLHRTQPRAHTVFGDHRTGDLGGLLDIR